MWHKAVSLVLSPYLRVSHIEFTLNAGLSPLFKTVLHCGNIEFSLPSYIKRLSHTLLTLYISLSYYTFRDRSTMCICLTALYKAVSENNYVSVVFCLTYCANIENLAV